MFTRKTYFLVIICLLSVRFQCFALDRRRELYLSQSSHLPRGGSEEDASKSKLEEITAKKGKNGSILDTENKSTEDDSKQPPGGLPPGAFLPKKLLLPIQQHAEKLRGHLSWAKEQYLKPKQVSDKLSKGWKATQDHSSQILSTVAPATVAVLCHKPLSFVRMYSLALLGSSVGFYMFLYFVSVGYALGVSLPVMVALCLVKPDMRTVTFWHSALVVLWGLRLSSFLLWREHYNWPALHRKVVHVNRVQAPPFREKLVGWMLYSLLYVCLLSPCWFRLSASFHNTLVPNNKFVERLSLLLQVVGLSMESIADLQKSRFKSSLNADGSSNRYEWYNGGLFSFSTHPNYLGEGLFWIGTFVGGYCSNFLQAVISTIGMLFLTWVMLGAVRSMAEKQSQKYLGNPLFEEFQETHSLWGPSVWRRRRSALEASTVDKSNVPDPAGAP